MKRGQTVKDYFEKIYKGSATEFHEKMFKELSNNEKRFIVTANPETLMIAEENARFRLALLKPTTEIVPDGIGIVKAGNRLGYPLKERITGVDLVSALLAEANELNKSIYFYGAKQEVLQLFIEKITKQHTNIVIAGYRNGYGQNDEEVFAEIIEKKPDIVLVALGIPRQELLIDKYYDMFEKGIFIGVGGSFDVLSGVKKRAPVFFVKLNLEWLYRILCEPKRINRFYKGSIRFIYKVKKTKR